MRISDRLTDDSVNMGFLKIDRGHVPFSVYTVNDCACTPGVPNPRAHFGPWYETGRAPWCTFMQDQYVWHMGSKLLAPILKPTGADV